MKLFKILIIGLLLLAIVYLNKGKETFNQIEYNNVNTYIRNSKQLKCADDSIFMDGWCYKKCKQGYSPDETNCVMECPSDLKSTKTHCLKESEFLGKEYKTLEECKNENINGCYKEENRYYAICGNDKKQVGKYCVDICPNGMLDNGFGCLRTRYIQGVGNVKEGEKCDKTMDRIGDTCYEKCAENYKPNGSLCIAIPK
jgi:hypothetical protein